MEVLKTMIPCYKTLLTEEDLRYLKQRAEIELAKKLFEKALPDQWYRIRLSFKTMPNYEMLRFTPDDSEPIVFIAKVDFDAIPERAVVYRSPETQFLQPEKSFRKKLKNCWRYMRDKTGGGVETVLIDGNEVNKNDRTQ